MIKQNKKVSIIVPVYNVENYIIRCINSLIRQTYENIEIIVVDDGSTDNSMTICNDLLLKDSRINLFHKENGGLSSARNYGIINSTGEYITFIDSDDDVDITYVEKLVNALEEKNVDISMCGRKIIYTYKNENVINSSKINNMTLNVDSFLNYIDDNTAYGSFACGKLYKRKIVLNAMFDETIYVYEDNLFCVEICKENPSFYYFDDKLYNYYVRNDSLSRKKFDDRKATAIDSLNKTINLCREYFPKYEKKYLLKKIKSLIWFKYSTNEKKYIRLINKELKNTNIWRNLYFNNDIAFKERCIYFLKNNFSRIFYFLLLKKQ